MRTGLLRHRIALQSPTVTQDAVGQPTATWATYATVWARHVPQGAAERLLGQQVVSAESAAWSIRYRDDVLVTHRIIDGAKTWEINGITDPDDRGRELLLACKAVK